MFASAVNVVSAQFQPDDVGENRQGAVVEVRAGHGPALVCDVDGMRLRDPGAVLAGEPDGAGEQGASDTVKVGFRRAPRSRTPCAGVSARGASGWTPARTNMCSRPSSAYALAAFWSEAMVSSMGTPSSGRSKPIVPGGGSSPASRII